MSGQVRVLSYNQAIPDGFTRIDCTSRSNEYKKMLSPFYLGPVKCYEGLIAQNVENAWQYSKVYADQVDADNNPTAEYFNWRDAGWNKTFADRHPKGKQIPLYSYYWNTDGVYEKLGYIEARKKIYVPLYAKAVMRCSNIIDVLKNKLKNENLALADFDGYDHKALGMSYDDVLNCKDRRMGHAFIIAMLIEDVIRT